MDGEHHVELEHMTESVLSELYHFAPLGIVIMDDQGRVEVMNDYARKLLMKEGIAEGHHLFSRLERIESTDSSNVYKFNVDKESVIGWLCRQEAGHCFLFHAESELEQLLYGVDAYRNMMLDFKAIFDHSYDVIYVSDGEGRTLRVSAASERLWGYKESELVGKTVYQLEAEGVYRPSVTREVLERGEKVSLVQTTKTGRRLLVVGTPIKDGYGNILRVVNASRDVTELKELENEIDLLKQMMEGYRQEIEQLRENEGLERRLVARSAGMKRVINFAKRVAKVDSPILLLGESGVGKEEIAMLIHNWSNRSEGPFLVANCETVSAEILEKELFGTTDLHGLIDMANSGTLFLERVDQMPLSVQAKLVRILQRENKADGKVKVRIIATATEDLSIKLEQRLFREDFYYFLNVVPVKVPPLRERKEDIIPLVLHTMKELNLIYHSERKFHPSALKRLEGYDWPGNVQELRNIIERMYVTSEGEWIGTDALPEYISDKDKNAMPVQVHGIMPLKEAIQAVEKELLTMAKEKYASTTQIANALQIDQSTVSRKLKRYEGL